MGEVGGTDTRPLESYSMTHSDTQSVCTYGGKKDAATADDAMFRQASLCWDKHNNTTKPAVSKGEPKDEFNTSPTRADAINWLASCVAPKGQLLTD